MIRPVKESLAAEYSTLQPLWSSSVQSHRSSPWSNWMWCRGWVGSVAYLDIVIIKIIGIIVR